MKKIIFLVICTMASQLLFSQSEVMEFYSMGFNTLWQENNGYTTHYFYGYEDYSEAFIFGFSIESGALVELSTGYPGTYYPFRNIGLSAYSYFRYDGQNNSIGYASSWENYCNGMEYRFENSRLVYWALAGGNSYDSMIPYPISDKIEQSNQGITISTNSSQYRYYNISRTELLDIFLKNYVDLLCKAIREANEWSNFSGNSDWLILDLLDGRTARELAIFRNCLYAIYGYKFSNSSWTEFFEKYLADSRAQYSNAEVTDMFTNTDKWILDLIIRHENGENRSDNESNENIDNNEIKINESDAIEIKTPSFGEVHTLVPIDNDKNSSLGIYIGISICFLVFMIIIGFIIIKKKRS
jgi:hypothetical protein